MISDQLIAYCLGLATPIVIVFAYLLLIVAFVLFLERKIKKIFLLRKPTATLQEIDEDIQQYFRKKRKLFIILVIILVLIFRFDFLLQLINLLKTSYGFW